MATYCFVLNPRHNDTNKVICDVCCGQNSASNVTHVFDGILICNSCSETIIKIHLLNRPIKTLCPMCENNQNDNCNYCDLPKIIEA